MWSFKVCAVMVSEERNMSWSLFGGYDEKISGTVVSFVTEAEGDCWRTGWRVVVEENEEDWESGEASPPFVSDAVASSLPLPLPLLSSGRPALGLVSRMLCAICDCEKGRLPLEACTCVRSSGVL
jgi:hypothetical protein